MEVTAERPYGDDEDNKDQEARREINGARSYTDTACCDWCGALLGGSSFQCGVCNSLTCTLCICEDGCCPACTGQGGKPCTSTEGKPQATGRCGHCSRHDTVFPLALTALSCFTQHFERVHRNSRFIQSFIRLIIDFTSQETLVEDANERNCTQRSKRKLLCH